MSFDSEWYYYAPIVIVILIALVGSLATRNATSKNGWYNRLNKSPYTPPNWVFGVAWTILYVLIAVAWVRANMLVTSQPLFQVINWLFALNMMLNLIWSLVFFGQGEFVGALIVVILMLVSAIALIYYLSFDVTCFVLIIIYFLWLCFATMLNVYAIEHNNMMEVKRMARN